MRRDFLTPKEVVDEMKSGSPLAQARSVLGEAMAEIETGLRHRRPFSTIEVRNVEFDAVIRIAEILGVELQPGHLHKN
ncbi:hypothetical protein OIU34_21445 [Pararhizobium sp. BT-229]|uniref:hypothetical protein n=1 Tax=Pararhizobium sp. BT-229 TaxID=2986923 RepID=UPI0021F730BB|nr:hypothetical protein [Pararhizobium sp. BT-229]MCV9964458.1 hypothetical protein [Pararhizobium sp. BT-229]